MCGHRIGIIFVVGSMSSLIYFVGRTVCLMRLYFVCTAVCDKIAYGTQVEILGAAKHVLHWLELRIRVLVSPTPLSAEEQHLWEMLGRMCRLPRWTAKGATSGATGGLTALSS